MVVPWVMAKPGSRSARDGRVGAGPSRRRNSAEKLGPGSSLGGKSGRVIGRPTLAGVAAEDYWPPFWT